MVSKTVMSKWVNAAVSNDDIQFRQAVHIVLHALSSDKQTADAFILKGGILLALKFGSTRFTRDIDFSCISSYSEFSEIDFRAGLDKSLKRSILTVDYDLEMKIQKIEKKPNEKKIPNPRFPALKITIGYCKKGSLREGRTLSNVISIDISYNDYYNQESDLFSDEINLKCYSLQEVMAEKIRSVLQQVERNRSRRQDIYVKKQNKKKMKFFKCLLINLLEKELKIT
jgi:predicted nucleotidyltransferase component of viral defense system